MKYWLSFICLVVSASAALSADSRQTFFKSYCVQCHGPDKQKADIRLDDISKFDAKLWQNIYKQLAAEEMPPDNKPQPTKTERQTLLNHALKLAGENSPIAATGLRRLNKREYGHTVRDLLGLRQGTFDPSEYVYADEVDEGFDTDAESLVISNELLLEYLNAAKKSLRQALFTADSQRPPVREIEVKPSRMQGTSRRYINHHRNYVIGRCGGKGKLYDGEKTRTMQYPGRYTITITAAGIDRERYPVRFTPAKGPIIMGFGILQDAAESVSDEGQIQRTFELKDEEDQTFTFDTWIDKGHYPYLSFVNGSAKPITQVRSNIRRRKIPGSAMKKLCVGPGIRVSKFRIEGPFHDEWPPETIRTTYDTGQIPDLTKQSAREKLVTRFATRAFRRPVSMEEVAPYLRYLDGQHATTGDWHESTIRTFAAMMASLDFLYLREAQGELTPHALASRLSYFLWSSMPDDELLALANSGRIQEPGVLRQQVQRLLNDPRADRFSDSFADQWLALDTLGSMPPDVKDRQFKIYHRQKLEPAMREETHRFVRHVLRENRSVRDFLDSDYSFLNAGLAELYGVPFKGDGFTKVVFPAGTKRGGILGHASVLTLSANGVETSPVVRGHWVLAELLGTPPPPPPAEVPAVVPDLNGVTTVRQLLEKHRNDPACMECHRRMDPLGFALEAYDPIGRHRTDYSKTQRVSTEGNYKGRDFADVTGLKQILGDQLQPFVRNLIIRIAEYAKGRKLVATDFKHVETILKQSSQNDHRLRDLILQIAISELMTQR